MTTTWLPGAQVVDMHNVRGNGPFGSNGPFLGVILHVNVSGPTSNGTSIDYFKNNPDQVIPNFQVYKDGSIVQFLPFNWQPWCQINGNFQYSAIETGGDPDQPLTDAQLASCAKILRVYHNDMGLQLKLANSPGQAGLGTHKMGGLSWGGHECPGDIRTAQRSTILNLVSNPQGELSMSDVQKILDAVAALKADQDALAARLDGLFSDKEDNPHRLVNLVKQALNEHDAQAKKKN